MRLQLKEASFVNKKGGKGKCVETDLAMEHSVRNAKDLIKSLGSNKTSQAIKRASLAADSITAVARYYEHVRNVPANSDRHTKKISETDKNIIKTKLRQLRPFKYQSGRSYAKMPHIPYTPFARINRQGLRTALQRHIKLCVQRNMM